MTSNLSYPGHEKGLFGTVKEWFGGRATSDDVKDEIVSGHACQKRGNRDETYYASSLCYWLPEITDGSARHLKGALTWRGGKYPGGKSLGDSIAGAGMCVKAATCHNNARGEDG